MNKHKIMDRGMLPKLFRNLWPGTAHVASSEPNSITNDDKPILRKKPTLIHRLEVSVLLRKEALRAKKWHTDIEECVGTRNPSDQDFPYAELRSMTLEYFGGYKRAESSDEILTDLVSSHCKKVNAFAACVFHFSAPGVELALDRYFQFTPRETGITAMSTEYLQALVAASYSRPDIFSRHDGEFAKVLLTIAGTPYGHPCIPASLITSLLSVLGEKMPSNYLLIDKAESLVAEFCEGMSTIFSRLEYQWTDEREVVSHEKDIELATGYSKALETLTKSTNASLDSIVKRIIPRWYCWARWKPSLERLQLWNAIASGSCQSFHSPLRSLCELEGPDLTADVDCNSTMGRKLLRQNELNPWLQSKGFRLGKPLSNDMEVTEQSVLTRFLDCAIGALYNGLPRAQLLCLFVEKIGLTAEMLDLYHSVDACLSDDFLSCLITPPGDIGNEDYTEMIIHGVDALSHGSNLRAAQLFRIEAGICIHHAAEMSLDQFERGLYGNGEWFCHAQQLWALRRGITAATWVHDAISRALLEASAQQSSMENILALQELYMNIQQENTVAMELLIALCACIGSYVSNGTAGVNGDAIRSVGSVVGSPADAIKWINLIHALSDMWAQTNQRSTLAKSLAFEIACLPNLGVDRRIEYVTSIPNIPESLQLHLRNNLASLRATGPANIIDFTNVITSLTESAKDAVCWNSLLSWAIKEYKVNVKDEYFTTQGVKAYRNWIIQLNKLGLGDDIGLPKCFDTWLSTLRNFKSVLQELEEHQGSKRALHDILMAGHEDASLFAFNSLLVTLDGEHRIAPRRLMQRLVISFTAKDGQLKLLVATLLIIKCLSEEDVAFCNKVFSLLGSGDPATSHERLTQHLRRSNLSPDVKTFLNNVSQMFNLSSSNTSFSGEHSAESITMDYNDRVEALLARATQMESCCLSINRRNPDGIRQMTIDLGLEQIANASLVTILMNELPHDLFDVIQEDPDGRIEFYFPLDHLNALEKLAFGLQGSEVLLAYLEMSERGIGSICVELEERSDRSKSCTTQRKSSSYSLSSSANSVKRNPKQTDSKGRKTKWKSKKPKLPVAITVESPNGPPNRLTHLVLQAFGKLCDQDQLEQIHLESVYNSVKKYIQSAANRCIVCLDDTGLRLHRATLCSKAQCASRFAEWDLCLQLDDIKNHSQAIDLLLAAVYASANTASLGTTSIDLLLPKWKLGQNNVRYILDALDSIPALSSLSSANSIHKSLSSQPGAGAILSWVCNSYQGFLIPATELYKIPNMPGIHQFLVVDNAPEIERAFAKHDHLQPRHVLFHGTSFDRLYSILTQGLRPLQGTPLQKHGGHGIYTAEEPTTSYSYLSMYMKSMGASSFFQKDQRSNFHNAGVMLVLEHAGEEYNWKSSGGIHVITDPSKIIIRYIWIIPPNVRVPRAQDVRIPLLGAFSGLKASACKRIEAS